MINQAALAQGAGGPERRNTMRKRIAVMKGDGIGPEIVNEALKVLETVASKYGHHFAYNFVDIGGVAIDNHGTPLPQATIDACLEADSVLLGHFVGSMVITSLALRLFYGYPWATLAVRIPNALILSAVNVVLLRILLENRSLMKLAKK